MDVESIKNVVIRQREEVEDLFERERIIRRNIDFRGLKGYLMYPNILAILGVRRSGKSVLSWQLAKGEEFAYINLFDERLSGMKTADLDKLVNAFYELYSPGIEFLIFDEIQHIPKWEMFVSRLRINKRLIITGSSSTLLSGELATYLTGRHIDFTLFPFDFSEHLRIRNIKLDKNWLYSSKQTSVVKRELNEYLLNGGFPEMHKFGKNIVVRIYSDIIERDIIQRHGIRKVSTFKEISKYIVSNASSEITYNRIKNIFGVGDIHTVKNYISYMSDAYLIIILERYSPKLKEQFLAPKKVYCIDTGIINSIGFKSSENFGRLMENLVAIELKRRNKEVYYWKDYQGREVDFVVKEGLKVKELIQVCYDLDFNSKEREVKALVKASKELGCNSLLVITWDHEGEEEFKGKRIEFRPLWKWLLFSQ